LGLATQDISNGVNGVITYFGYVRGLDTRGTANTAISVGDETWAVGDQLYVHPTAAGKLTNVEPAAPNVKICVASILIRNQTAGVVFVRPTTNLYMTDLSDVQITTPAANQFLVYAGNRWQNTALDISVDTSPTLGGNLAGAGFNISNVGTITATGNVTGGNILTAGIMSSTGNATHGNMTTAGLTSTASLSITGNTATVTTANYSIGYLNIPQISLAANTTTALTDSGKHYYSTSASNLALTIANNTSVGWTVGTAITIVNAGTANILINQDTGVSMYLAGNATAGNRVLATFGMATIMNTAANVWFINGTGLT
jgi:hypothetical protein